MSTTSEIVAAGAGRIYFRDPLEGLDPTPSPIGHPVWERIAPEIQPHEFPWPERMCRFFLEFIVYRARQITRVMTMETSGHMDGVPFRFRSSYRSPERNATIANVQGGVGGAPVSSHTEQPCRAVDLAVLNRFERALVLDAFYEVGIRRRGIYPESTDAGGGVLHVDASPALPSPRIWTKF